MLVNYEDLKALGINLLSNAIWFFAGLLSGVVIASGRKFLRPRFWSEMMRARIVIVVGAHEAFDDYEASGMIGTGDALALAEFISYFKRNRFTNFEVSSARTVTTAQLGQNLVLIGGADANSASRDFVTRSHDRLETKFGDPDRGEMSFELAGTKFMPERGETMKDAAAIIYLPNPHASDRRVILVSGCYGHGTEAAARLMCESGSFAARTRWLSRFEAAVSCEVIGSRPTAAVLRCLVE